MMLTSVQNLKDYLGIPSAETGKDGVLELIIKGASAFFETETRRKYDVEQYIEKQNGDNSQKLILSQFPIIYVREIKVDGSVISLADEPTLDINYQNGILTRERGWPSGFRNIEVTYTSGFILPDESGESGPGTYYTLPYDIELAVLKLAARTYERRTAEGVASAENVSYKDMLDEEIERTIKAHLKTKA